MAAVAVFLFLATMTLTTNSRVVPTQTHLLMPGHGGAGLDISLVNCESWRLGIETNNVRNWRRVIPQCANYVATYMESDQYESDCDTVVDEAIKYVNSLPSIADNDIWVFDTDETALSNLEYYRRDDVAYGAIETNGDKLWEWFELGKAKALKPVLRLYDHLISKKVKIVFLTGVSDDLEEVREMNLRKEGYKTFEELILKSEAESDLHGAAFKSKKRKELEEVYKYNIIGNIGDQWSDITGTNVGKRTFKIPNPMYYL